MSQMRFRCQVVLVICLLGLSRAADEHKNKLTKLWSLSGTAARDGSAVVNVTSASILIQPTSYSSDKAPARTSRESKLPYTYKKYAFKPRAIPLTRTEQPQVERNVYYSQDNANKYKSEVLFPGNYFPIAKEKSENATEEFNPLQGGPFHPKLIPLMRGQDFQRRSLDVEDDPIIDKPDGFTEAVASRRSISGKLTTLHYTFCLEETHSCETFTFKIN